ncbi:hypothetical protein [Actinomadura sp. 7K507]|uniref:hypothetical protein n=1 Tax=Actinomadura sp. 7K507 TaxID=2530365 RepID=UPI001052B842|nr:hypothetical protein [Actinomadura sp. 7K507]TDC91987.1 hypothetical protein E1285_12475 [Actinomadura sp. 7K507]
MNRLRRATHAHLARRLTSLTVQRRNPRRGKPVPEPVLARAFSHPQGAGVIGPGAQRLLRSVLVDALTARTQRCEVVIARDDLERLLGAASSRLPSRFASVLHVTGTLEDAIEHLESRPRHISATGPEKQFPILWLATPGADADVVHQTLESQPATDLVTLFNGPWPYGPTHFIDTDGPRRPPAHDLHLLTRDQAIVRLRALGSAP